VNLGPTGSVTAALGRVLLAVLDLTRNKHC
jgi:hypothetical protein